MPLSLKNCSNSFLQVLASEREESKARRDARAELAKRGVSFDEGHDRAAMDQKMGMAARRGTSTPCVRRDGRSVTYGGPARAADGKHDREAMRATMRAAVGLPNDRGASVHREGRTVTYELLPSDEAKKEIKASAAKKAWAQ